jgi:hypothetical protein
VWSALRLGSGAIVVGTDADGRSSRSTATRPPLGAIPGAIATVALAEAGGTLYAGGMPSDTVWKLDAAARPRRTAS